MIVICMAIYDTVENKRTEYTKRSVHSLIETINEGTTKIVLIDNASCAKTRKFLNSCEIYEGISVIHNETNIGTAEAINLGIKNHSVKGDYIVKIDNDIVISHIGWADEMVRCFEKDPKLGILGLKRPDLPNSPDSKEYPTELKFLPHTPSEPWLIIEECGDIIGSCIMINPKLLDKIGYICQPGIYGYDDVLLCTRARVAGFYNAFYPSVECSHIDDGLNPFTEWKRKYAGQYLSDISKIEEGYWTNPNTIYYNPFI
jgi:GT2 family glycosyltransferase